MIMSKLFLVSVTKKLDHLISHGKGDASCDFVFIFFPSQVRDKVSDIVLASRFRDDRQAVRDICQFHHDAMPPILSSALPLAKSNDRDPSFPFHVSLPLPQ